MTRWDGMGWDGMRWDVLDWDGVCGRVCVSGGREGGAPPRRAEAVQADRCANRLLGLRRDTCIGCCSPDERDPTKGAMGSAEHEVVASRPMSRVPS